MVYLKEIKNIYEVTEKDRENFKIVGSIMQKYANEFAQDIQRYILDKYGTNEFMSDTSTEKHIHMLELWYQKFFTGNIDDDLIAFIKNLVKSHMDLSIESAKFMAVFSYIRKWLHEKIFRQIEADVLRKDILLSVHKFLDIQMNLINSFYTEFEIKKYTREFGLKNGLVRFSEKFLLFTHFILVFFLISITLSAIAILGIDIFHKYQEHASNIIIYALGSLLMIWVLIELLHTEITSIKGGQFKISIFIGVALVAFVREVLILKLQHNDDNGQMIVAIGGIFILGIIYFITFWAEKFYGKRRNR